MAQGARDAEPLDVPVGGDLGLDAHDGVSAEQLDRRRRTGEIGTGEEAGRQRRRIDLETHRQRCRRRHAGLNHLVQVQRVGPERLVAKGPVSKDVLALRGTFTGGPAMRSPAGGSGRPAGATASGLSLQASRSATSATKRIRPPDVTGIQWRSITYVGRFYNERLSSLTRTGRSAPSCRTNATRGEGEGEGGATSRR